MGNLGMPLQRLRSEETCSKLKPNGYGSGGDGADAGRGPDGDKLDEGPMGSLCIPRRSRAGDKEEEEGRGAPGGGASRNRRRRQQIPPEHCT